MSLITGECPTSSRRKCRCRLGGWRRERSRPCHRFIFKTFPRLSPHHVRSADTPSASLFGSPRIISLLPSLLRSPVLDLQWSSLVHGAVQRNLAAWRWVSPPSPAHENQTRPAAPDPDTHAPLERVLALHLRQGDFKEHCAMLAAWRSGYLGVNEAVGPASDA